MAILDFSNLEFLVKMLNLEFLGHFDVGKKFSQASLMAGCLGDGPPRCVREFPRCGPNGIRVATVTVNFPHPVRLHDVGPESAPVRG